jgi:magnesium chelatase family protein
MIARIDTVAFQGIDVLPIDMRAQVAAGLPAFTMVGPIADRLAVHS